MNSKKCVFLPFFHKQMGLSKMGHPVYNLKKKKRMREQKWRRKKYDDEENSGFEVTKQAIGKVLMYIGEYFSSFCYLDFVNILLQHIESFCYVHVYFNIYTHHISIIDSSVFLLYARLLFCTTGQTTSYSCFQDYSELPSQCLFSFSLSCLNGLFLMPCKCLFLSVSMENKFLLQKILNGNLRSLIQHE